ncbi:hypothetical protein [Legionella rowbothamii]|uniref:hypothetical protein n=1 Tax=Legionella rowbothamii TaxID=96229 RepID=UPI00105578D3|nr:hypothetical protein [Legionella rowbothamii]
MPNTVKAFDEQKENELFARRLGDKAPLIGDYAQSEQREKADALLNAEKSPNLDSTKEGCIKELERYINSRGSLYEGKFSPSLTTKIFRDKDLTLYKVAVTLTLIENIRNANSLEGIRDLLEDTYKSDPNYRKKLFFPVG